MTGQTQLRLSFYGDDLTGSTDALEQLSLAGLSTMLFLEPPTRAQLSQFPGLEACGVAGLTRSLPSGVLAGVLRPALQSLRALGAPHVHYKICSTFDSSPKIGSLGRVLEVAAEIFPAPFTPLLAAAPWLGRYTLFGNHFARYGIGSQGAVYRLDRHPSISLHPVTPMREADLRRHLARQTDRRTELFDILQLSLPPRECRTRFHKLIAGGPAVVLFDALAAEQLPRIGGLIDPYGSRNAPLFSLGSSGIEAALCGHWRQTGRLTSRRPARHTIQPVEQVLAGSGSCSPVTSGQIAWALKNGFAEVPLNAAALVSPGTAGRERQRAIRQTVRLLQTGRSVLVHTTRRGSDDLIQKQLQGQTAKILGTALGEILLGALRERRPGRLCLAGGDTASFAARAMHLTALALIAPFTPGAPLCRACAPTVPVEGLEIVFKGGQLGSDDFFGRVKSGNNTL
jgi:uncharacterized protein YgbK (DUF1537 family)